MSGWDWSMTVLWTLLTVALVASAIWAITTSRRGDEAPAETNSFRSARQILDERLARGEIDADEYERLREKLDRPTPASPTPA